MPAPKPKSHWFDSQLQHMLGLQARSAIRGCKRQTHTDVSLSLPHSLLSKRRKRNTRPQARYQDLPFPHAPGPPVPPYGSTKMCSELVNRRGERGRRQTTPALRTVQPGTAEAGWESGEEDWGLSVNRRTEVGKVRWRMEREL